MPGHTHQSLLAEREDMRITIITAKWSRLDSFISYSHQQNNADGRINSIDFAGLQQLLQLRGKNQIYNCGSIMIIEKGHFENT